MQLPHLASTLFLLVSCSREPTTTSDRAPEVGTAERARGAATIGELKKSLVGALTKAMATGVPAAIEVCHAEAPTLTAALARDGVVVGRATRKPRNPRNLAAGWQSDALTHFEGLRAAGKPLEGTSFARRLSDGRIAYAEPLVIQSLCVACHGASLAPEVQDVLAAKYPEDRATGYQVGDLRGVAWVELRHHTESIEHAPGIPLAVDMWMMLPTPLAAQFMRAAMAVLHALRGCAPIACLLLIVWGARPAAAQTCGGQRSTCSTCHEERGERSVNRDETPWHTDHAFGDFCAPCHGGNPQATERAFAHVGMVNPLTATRCASCHQDAAPLVTRYDAERARRHPPRVEPAQVAATSPGVRIPDVIAGGFALAFALAGTIAIVRIERRRRGRQVAPIGRAVIAVLRARGWSPTLAGVALGVVITVSLAFGHRLSGAAVYQQLAGPIGARVAPASPYWHHVLGPLTLSWDLLAWFGVILGALASALASGTFRIRTMPDRDWVEVHGPSVARRWLIAFVGAALTAFAAGIAGGCTASLAMSGGAVLIPGAFAFMAGMFAGGIPTALVVYRGRGGV